MSSGACRPVEGPLNVENAFGQGKVDGVHDCYVRCEDDAYCVAFDMDGGANCFLFHGSGIEYKGDSKEGAVCYTRDGSVRNSTETMLNDPQWEQEEKNEERAMKDEEEGVWRDTSEDDSSKREEDPHGGDWDPASDTTDDETRIPDDDRKPDNQDSGSDSTPDEVTPVVAPEDVNPDKNEDEVKHDDDAAKPEKPDDRPIEAES